MTIVAVAGQKGGGGKSTLCANLGAALGPSVLIADGDPQQTLVDWRAMDPDGAPEVVPVDVGQIAALRQVEGVKWVLLDLPPGLEKPTAEAVRTADRILIPLRASPHDLWAADHLIELVKAAGVPARFVICQARPGGRLVRELRAALMDYGIPTMKTVISARVAYPEAASRGLTVLDRRAWAAAAEDITNLAKEVRQWR